MTFDPDDPRLTAFALGELDDEADRLAVESLVAGSPEAARFVAEIRQTAALLTETLRSEPSPGLSIVQRLDLDARLGAPAVVPIRPRLSWQRALAGLAAAVALAAAGFGVGRLSAGPGGDRALGLDLALAEAPAARAPMPVPASESEAPSAPTDPAPAPVAAETFSARVEDTPALSQESGQLAESERVALEEMGRGQSTDLSVASNRPPDDSGAPGNARRALAQDFSAPRDAKDEAEAATGLDSLREDIAVKRHESGPAGARIVHQPAVPAAGPAADSMAALPPSQAPAGMSLGIRQEQDEVRLMQAFGGGQAGQAQSPNTPAQAAPLSAAAAAPISAGVYAAGRGRSAKVEGETVVEVIDHAEDRAAQRFAFDAPVRDLGFDPTGSKLLATTADRSVTLFDVESGLLLNSLQVDRGPVPAARFGPRGELILSNLVDGPGADAASPADGWRNAREEPVAALPVRPGAVGLDEVGRWLDGGRVPIGREVPVAALVNAPPYPTERPEAGATVGVAIDARVISAPWDDRLRLVRVALVARDRAEGALADPGNAPAPEVASEVVAEVEFNPARVASYRPVGFDGRLLAASDGVPPGLRAGEQAVVLFEIDPAPGQAGQGSQFRAYKYQAVAAPEDPAASRELLTVSLSYRDPARGEEVAVELPVPDAASPIAEAPDDVRLAAALAWFGRAIAGEFVEPAAALDGAAALVRSCAEGFLPAYRDELIALIGRARAMAQAEPIGGGSNRALAPPGPP